MRPEQLSEVPMERSYSESTCMPHLSQTAVASRELHKRTRIQRTQSFSLPQSKLYHLSLDESGDSRRALLRRTASFGGGPLVAQTLKPSLIPANPKIRWLVLVLVCLLLFGNYFAYDNPAALNVLLQKYLDIDYDTWQYNLNLLYSLYSLPNMFLPMIGGQMVDILDPKKVLIALSITVCIGQTLYSVGVSIKSFPLMILGRMLFGIGGESVSVVQSSITTTYFRDKELAFALGMNLCIARLGSVANSILSPKIATLFGVPSAVWVATMSCYLSFLFVLILTSIMASQEINCSTTEDQQPLIRADEESIPDSEQSETNGTEKSMLGTLYTDIHSLPGSFWLVCMICIMLYGTVVPFNAIASDFLMSKWYHGDIQMAGFVMRYSSLISIPDILSAFMVPIFGIVVDKYGHRISWLTLCCLLIIGSHAALGFTNFTPIPAFVLLGISYAIYGVVIWPSIACVAQYQEEKRFREDGVSVNLLGTAFGISTSALNTSLTILPLLSAGIRVTTGSFTYLEMYFMCLGILAMGCCMFLFMSDKLNDNVLQRVPICNGIITASPIPSTGDLHVQDECMVGGTFIEGQISI